MSNIRILGGEPLLSKDLMEYILIARKIYLKSNITVVTNGLLLEDMGDSFFLFLKENNISVSISYYIGNTRKKVKKGIERLMEFGISFYVYPTTYFAVEHSDNQCENIEKVYNNCKLRIRPVSLYRGHIYACMKPFSIRHYDLKYGTNYKNINDGINIYDEEIDGKAIKEQLEKPMSTCKTCSLKPAYIKWSQGKVEKWQWKNDKQNKNILDYFEWYDYLKGENSLKYNVLEVSKKDKQIKNYFFSEKDIKEKVKGDVYIWISTEKEIYLYEELLKKTIKNLNLNISGILNTGDFVDKLFDYMEIISAREISDKCKIVLLVSDYNRLYSEIKRIKKRLII